MKKIINGKRYNTDTAKLIGTYEPDTFGPSDFGWFCEEIYRKTTGEYFIYGWGNAASRYAENVYGSWGSGEAITPLTYDEAREWIEKHLDADTYENEFGPAPEGDESGVVLSVRVSQQARAALDRMAAKTGRSKSVILTELLLALN